MPRFHGPARSGGQIDGLTQTGPSASNNSRSSAAFLESQVAKELLGQGMPRGSAGQPNGTANSFGDFKVNDSSQIIYEKYRPSGDKAQGSNVPSRGFGESQRDSVVAQSHPQRAVADVDGLRPGTHGLGFRAKNDKQRLSHLAAAKSKPGADPVQAMNQNLVNSAVFKERAELGASREAAGNHSIFDGMQELLQNGSQIDLGNKRSILGHEYDDSSVQLVAGAEPSLTIVDHGVPDVKLEEARIEAVRAQRSKDRAPEQPKLQKDILVGMPGQTRAVRNGQLRPQRPPNGGLPFGSKPNSRSKSKNITSPLAGPRQSEGQPGLSQIQATGNIIANPAGSPTNGQTMQLATGLHQ